MSRSVKYCYWLSFTLDLNKLIMTEVLVCSQKDQALSRQLFAAHGRRDNFFKMTDGGFHSQMPFLFVLGLPQGMPFPCSPASCFDNMQTSQMSGILPTETPSLRHGRMNSKSSLFCETDGRNRHWCWFRSWPCNCKYRLRKTRKDCSFFKIKFHLKDFNLHCIAKNILRLYLNGLWLLTAWLTSSSLKSPECLATFTVVLHFLA